MTKYRSKTMTNIYAYIMCIDIYVHIESYLCIYLLIIILMNHDVEHLWKTINSTTEMEKLLESSSKSSVKISWDEHLIKYGLYAININDPGFLGKFLDSA